MVIQPANAAKTKKKRKEKGREFGAEEDTTDAKERAKEFDKQMEMKPKEALTGTSRGRKNPEALAR